MSCNEIEREIYLYNELSLSEKVLVDEHVKNCKDCFELLKVVQKHQAAIKNISEVRTGPINHGRLTRNIMQAIQLSHRQQSFFSTLLQHSFLKYSLVATSLILAILFVSEQQVQVEMPKRIAGEKTVILKSQSLSNVIKKENKHPSLYACIKSGGCDNSFIENLKQKNL